MGTTWKNLIMKCSCFNKYREGERRFFFFERGIIACKIVPYIMFKEIFAKTPKGFAFPFVSDCQFLFVCFGRLTILVLISIIRVDSWLVGNVTRWWISFWEGEFEEELRLEETQVGISFHHVLDPPLGPIENVLVRIIRLDVGQCQEPCLRVQVDLEISKKSGNVSYQMR